MPIRHNTKDLQATLPAAYADVMRDRFNLLHIKCLASQFAFNYDDRSTTAMWPRLIDYELIAYCTLKRIIVCHLFSFVIILEAENFGIHLFLTHLVLNLSQPVY